MSYSMIAVNIIAAALIVFVLWWFFGDKLTSATAAADVPFTIVIKNGVYQPSLINIPANKPVILHFLREDDGACASTVIFPQLKMSFELPKNKVVAVELPPQPPGMMDFTCQMGMYRGKLVIN